MLVLIKDLGVRIVNKQHRRYGLFECDCGNFVELLIDNVKRGHTKSCGCLFTEGRKKGFHTTHGLHSHALHNVWNGIKNRCYNSNTDKFHNYGGRGITICDEWKSDFKAFYDWCINNGYIKGLQIDRRDVNGNYEPSNCRFITNAENARNKQETIFIELNGIKKTIPEWAETLNIKYATIYSRLKKGWPVLEILVA